MLGLTSIRTDAKSVGAIRRIALVHTIVMGDSPSRPYNIAIDCVGTIPGSADKTRHILGMKPLPMNLRFYLLRRIVLIVPTLIGLSILTFSIARLVPGDPVGLAAGPPGHRRDQRSACGANSGSISPLPVQYISYMAGLFRGDWGQSLYYAPRCSARPAHILAGHA